MSEDLSGLPPFLAEFARKAGLKAALQLVSAKGGVKIKLPKTLADEHWLIPILGREAAQHLVDLRPGEEVDVPLAAALKSKKQAILRSSLGTNDTARQLGCTARYVRMVREDTQDPNQPRLL